MASSPEYLSENIYKHTYKRKTRIQVAGDLRLLSIQAALQVSSSMGGHSSLGAGVAAYWNYRPARLVHSRKVGNPWNRLALCRGDGCTYFRYPFVIKYQTLTIAPGV